MKRIPSESVDFWTSLCTEKNDDSSNERDVDNTVFADTDGNAENTVSDDTDDDAENTMEVLKMLENQTGEDVEYDIDNGALNEEIDYDEFNETNALDACLGVQYIPNRRNYAVTIRVNHHLLIHRFLSLLHPPRLCYRYGVVSGCLHLYNVNLGRRTMFARLNVIINLRRYRMNINLRLACFRIPYASSSKGITEMNQTPHESFEESSLNFQPPQPDDEFVSNRQTTEHIGEDPISIDRQDDPRDSDVSMKSNLGMMLRKLHGKS